MKTISLIKKTRPSKTKAHKLLILRALKVRRINTENRIEEYRKSAIVFTGRIFSDYQDIIDSVNNIKRRKLKEKLNEKRS
jgi:hypothetical protein